MAELGTEGAPNTPTPLEPGGEAASALTPVSDGVGPMNTNTTFSTNQKAHLLSSYFSFFPNHAPSLGSPPWCEGYMYLGNVDYSYLTASKGMFQRNPFEDFLSLFFVCNFSAIPCCSLSLSFFSLFSFPFNFLGLISLQANSTKQETKVSSNLVTLYQLSRSTSVGKPTTKHLQFK